MQVVLPERGPRLHDIHDDIRQTQDGRQLDGALEGDDVDVPAPSGVKVSRDPAEFRSHAQRPPRCIAVVPPARHGHAAAAHAQVQKLVDIRPILQQDVLARHAEVRGAALHIDGHVRRFDPEIAYTGGGVFKQQFAAVVEDGVAGVAGRRKEAVDLFPEPPLGQGHVEHRLRHRRRLLSHLPYREPQPRSHRQQCPVWSP